MAMAMRAPSALLALILLVAVSMGELQHKLVLIGGRLEDNNTMIYSKIIQLAGGAGNASIGIITAASADPQGSHEAYAANFLKYGAKNATWIPIDKDHRDNTENPEVLELMKHQTGFFFSGGDQSLLKDIFQPNNFDTPATTLLKSAWRKGVVISGTSAGCDILQGRSMITGGESFDGLTYGAFASEPPPHIRNPVTYEPDGGFGFYDQGILDTHVDSRGRQGRNIALMIASKRRFGFGVDEDTALVVRYSASSDVVHHTVVGTNGVNIYDLTDAVITRDPPSNKSMPAPFAITNITYHYLTNDDTIWFTKGLSRGLLSTASWKWRERRNVVPSRISKDIFSSAMGEGGRQNPREFVLIAQGLIDSRANTTYALSHETTPYQIRVDFRSTQPAYKGIDPTLNVTRITVLHMRLDMYSVVEAKP